MLYLFSVSKCQAGMISGSMLNGPAADDRCILGAGECTNLLGVVYNHIWLARNVSIVKDPSGPLAWALRPSPKLRCILSDVSKLPKITFAEAGYQTIFEMLERARDRLDDRGANLRLGSSQLASIQNDTHFLASLYFSGDWTSWNIVPYQANNFQGYFYDFQQFLCILQTSLSFVEFGAIHEGFGTSFVVTMDRYRFFHKDGSLIGALDVRKGFVVYRKTSSMISTWEVVKSGFEFSGFAAQIALQVMSICGISHP